MVTMNHDYTKGQMIGLAVGFMIIPTVFYSLRVWAKLLVKRFAWDDYLTGAALVSVSKLITPLYVCLREKIADQVVPRWSPLRVARYS